MTYVMLTTFISSGSIESVRTDHPHTVYGFPGRKKLLYKKQFGFRAKMSTQQAAILFIDDIRRNVDEGKLVGSVFIDLSRAFDTISHSQLISKLPSYGVHDKELMWFTDYLFHRQTMVQYGHAVSETVNIYSSVPQGSILGPLLFLVIFNDLTDVLAHSQVIKYADDTVLYVPGKDPKVISYKLAEDLNKLAKWFTDNELIINLKKGKREALLFGTPQRVYKNLPDLSVLLNMSSVLVTTSYKYLGVTIDSTKPEHIFR